MRIQGKDDLRELLAAEYVLGTLSGAARRRFEHWLRGDLELVRIVARWDAYLAPLTEVLPELAPPPRVWEALVRRIPALAPSETPTRGGWLENFVFWRAGAIAMTAVALVAVGIALYGPQFAPRPTPTQVVAEAAYVTNFADPKTHRPIAVMMIPSRGNEVVLQLVAADVVVPPGKTLELWTAKPGGTGMAPAGLVPAISNQRVVRFTVPDARALRGATLVGLSLEPAGGSVSPTAVIGVGTIVSLTT